MILCTVEAEERDEWYMQKLYNNPHRVVEEMLQGYLKSHSKLIAKTGHPRAFVLKQLDHGSGKVGVVSGGGTGHFPAFIGYLRPGYLDAVAVGNVFEAPPAEVFFEAFRQADCGAGVVCIYGNYQLDNRCVKEAVRMAEKENIRVELICANDDIATISEDGDRSGSRGLAGEVLLFRIAGAAASEGKSLDEISALLRRANDRMRSIGVALSACIIPEVGAPKFEVINGTMEFGIGHHGDPGLFTCKTRTANETADLMMEEILKTYDRSVRHEVIVLVSGLGGTTQMELYILYNRIADILRSRGISCVHAFVGNFFTSLDMKGVSVTVMETDEELSSLVCKEGEWI